MKVDSCRKCGIPLEVSRMCDVCEEPIEFQCQKCHWTSDEQIHQNCNLVSCNYHLLKATEA